MNKSLITQLREKEAEQLTYIIKVVLPVFVFLAFVLFYIVKSMYVAYSIPIRNFLHPSPTSTSTATQTLTPTATFTITPTFTLTSTVTMTPTPTPLPFNVVVNWDKMAVFELASSGSINVSNGYLPRDKELELVRYCSPNKGEYWGLVRYTNRFGDYGWVFIDNSFNSLLVKNERRPLLDLIKQNKNLLIDCPDKYTPVP